MIIKLTKDNGLRTYLNSSHLLLVEEQTSGSWFVTVGVLAPHRMPPSSPVSGPGVAHRVLEFDDAAAAPLIRHLDTAAAGRAGP